MEHVEISAGERSALLLVVSMHCLVLYCYLLASTKRGNESEALREGNLPAGRQGSHNNIAPFRPTSTDCAAGRGAAAVATHKLRGGAAQSRWYPRRRYLPLLPRRRLRRIPQFGQMAVGGKLVRSKTVATLWLLRAGSRGQQPLDGSIVNTSLLERKVDIPCERAWCRTNMLSKLRRPSVKGGSALRQWWPRLPMRFRLCRNALSRDRV